MVLVALGIGALALQIMGPPSKVVSAVPTAVPAPLPPAASQAVIASALPLGPIVPPLKSGAVHSPDRALLEPTADPAVMLPRIAADGRTPMRFYAAPFDVADARPRIGLLFDGFGLAEGESRDAINTLPSGVTLAFSPYGVHLDALLAAARARGHEYLLSIPMESQGYPLNDAGNHSLLTGADPAANAQNFTWALGRIEGYVGATGALDGLRGERFAASTTPFSLVRSDLTARGLLYVDPRPGTPPSPGMRAVDLVVDEPATRADIDDKLARLEAMAREHGSALGLAGPLRPVTVVHIAAWARELDARGLALAPVSALVSRKDEP